MWLENQRKNPPEHIPVRAAARICAVSSLAFSVAIAGLFHVFIRTLLSLFCVFTQHAANGIEVAFVDAVKDSAPLVPSLHHIGSNHQGKMVISVGAREAQLLLNIPDGDFPLPPEKLQDLHPVLFRQNIEEDMKFR